jgi:hypothetical protein
MSSTFLGKTAKVTGRSVLAFLCGLSTYTILLFSWHLIICSAGLLELALAFFFSICPLVLRYGVVFGLSLAVLSVRALAYCGKSQLD